MSQIFYILLAPLLIAVSSVLLGRVLLRWVTRGSGVALSRGESYFLGALVGSACVAALVFAMAAVGVARRGAFTIAAVVLMAGALFSLRRPDPDVPRHTAFPGAPWRWQWFFGAVYAVFGSIYLSVAMAPESSVEGSTHYLARVSVWARAFGFSDAGAAWPDGMESLFLFAFAIGRHSAAAMVEWLFLMALPLGILLYARRIGQPRAGIVAALLVFVNPLLARTGTIAAPDAVIACVGFSLFYAIEIYRKPLRHRRVILPIAILAGFWMWVGIQWLQREASSASRTLSGLHAAPLEWTIHGEKGNGLLGPIFLLVPLGLLSLRLADGRRLWLWSLLLALPLVTIHDPRIFVPALPFLFLGLTLAVVEWRGVLWMLLVAGPVMSWPALMKLDVDEPAWRIRGSEWTAALRREPEDAFLEKRLNGYHATREMEKTVPAGERVLLLSPLPIAYQSHMIVDGSPLSPSTFGRGLGDGFRATLAADRTTGFDPRSAAGAAVKQAGIGWVIMNFSDPGAEELFKNHDDWGLSVRWYEENRLLFQVKDVGQ